MIVTIKRQRTPEDAPYWQSFSYNGPLHVPVSAVLDAINYTDDLYDTDGKPAPRIRWECSCMQALCGGCAMVINGVPALACNTFADEVKGEELVLAPLSKFPVVADLIVDRSVIYQNLNQAKAYIEERKWGMKEANIDFRDIDPFDGEVKADEVPMEAQPKKRGRKPKKTA